jgi:hypothetical protein
MAADFKQAARTAAKRFGIPERLFLELIQKESGWRVNATSPAGAIGLGQLMPGTARSLGVNPWNPMENLVGAAKYLSDQFRTFKRWDLALAAYNAGPGNVSNGRWKSFAETRNYVAALAPFAAKSPTSATARSVSGTTSQAVPTHDQGLESPEAMASAGQQYARGILKDLSSGDYDPVKSLQGLVETSRVASQALPPGPDTPETAERLTAPRAGVLRAEGTKTGQAWGGSQGIAQQLAKGIGLKVTSTKRDRRGTASGGESDHWVGAKNAYAVDYGGSVPQMDKAAVQIARRLGIQYKQGQPLVATVTRGKFRIQVIYRSNVGGNHYDHIHVGVRRVS